MMVMTTNLLLKSGAKTSVLAGRLNYANSLCIKISPIFYIANPNPNPAGPSTPTSTEIIPKAEVDKRLQEKTLIISCFVFPPSAFTNHLKNSLVPFSRGFDHLITRILNKYIGIT